MTRMRYSEGLLEALIAEGGRIGALAKHTLEQKRHLHKFITTPDMVERQLRDLTAENKRLRAKIAELESLGVGA